jgi:hypothetical protein
VIRVLITLVALLGLVYLILPFIGCQPFEALWRKIDPGYNTPYKCIDFFLEALIIGTLDGITDLAACVIPLVIISQRTKPFRNKTGLAVILMLGLVYVVF